MLINFYSLIQAGNAADAMQECENLKKEGSGSNFAICLLGLNLKSLISLF